MRRAQPPPRARVTHARMCVREREQQRNRADCYEHGQQKIVAEKIHRSPRHCDTYFTSLHTPCQWVPPELYLPALVSRYRVCRKIAASIATAARTQGVS
ncbi:MAG: hypothetical protein E6K53_06430 [Gammaproteobacteria bacterium]|nr:MAG: hypothetical protein E6K53_06430 [Gammaproteobacteria bacterium]